MSIHSPVILDKKQRAALSYSWSGGHDLTRIARRLVTRLGIVTFALTVTAGAQAGLPGSAAADSAGGTLHYNCVLSPFPGQAMNARLVLNAPSSIVAGQTTPAFSVDATATVGPIVTWALGLVEAATVEGTVDAPGVVRAPEGNSEVGLRLTVSRTGVPASGPMTVRATGTAPQRVFRQPGPASITAGNTMTMRFVPRNADGNLTPAGEVDLSCTLDPGQDTVVFSFEITPADAAPPAAGTPGRAPSPTAGPARPGTAGAATPGAAGTAQPGAAGSPPSPAGTTTSNAAASTTANSALPAPEAPAGTSADVASVASSAVAPLAANWRWWLIGVGILVVVTVALGGLWWLRRRKT